MPNKKHHYHIMVHYWTNPAKKFPNVKHQFLTFICQVLILHCQRRNTIDVVKDQFLIFDYFSIIYTGANPHSLEPIIEAVDKSVIDHMNAELL